MDVVAVIALEKNLSLNGLISCCFMKIWEIQVCSALGYLPHMPHPITPAAFLTRGIGVPVAFWACWSWLSWTKRDSRAERKAWTLILLLISCNQRTWLLLWFLETAGVPLDALLGVGLSHALVQLISFLSKPSHPAALLLCWQHTLLASLQLLTCTRLRRQCQDSHNLSHSAPQPHKFAMSSVVKAPEWLWNRQKFVLLCCNVTLGVPGSDLFLILKVACYHMELWLPPLVSVVQWIFCLLWGTIVRSEGLRYWWGQNCLQPY